MGERQNEEEGKIRTNEQLKMVAAYHNHGAGTYDTKYFEKFGLYHRITLDNISRFLPKGRDQPILDAGGGTGIWTIELARLGYRVVLTDISEDSLGMARDKLSALNLADRVKIVRSNICDMREFEDEQFAMVLCEGDPLSYCGDHHAATREMVRVVQESGIVIASVDNRAAGLKMLKDSTNLAAIQRAIETGDIVNPSEDERFRYVMHAFTPEELREVFEKNGLAVERIIGKPVFAWRLSLGTSEDAAMKDSLYRLEKRYNDDPAYYPWGGHLEIVGRKRTSCPTSAETVEKRGLSHGNSDRAGPVFRGTFTQ